MKPDVVLRLLEGASVVDRQGIHFLELPASSYRPPLPVRNMTPGFQAAVEQLLNGSPTASSLMTEVLRNDGPTGAGRWHQFSGHLWRMAMIRQTLLVDEKPFATLTPLSFYFRFQEHEIEADKRFLLSRFAYMHLVGETMRLESPTGHADLNLHDPRAMTLLGALASPQSATELATTCGLEPEQVQVMLNFLLNMEAVVTDGQQAPDPIRDPWEFHDLLFHSRSRLGRHDRPYGGTYPFKDVFPAIPTIKPPMDGEVIELATPDLTQIREQDPSFTEVLESRKSIRSQDEQPITVAQLGEFLYRSSRVKKLSADGSVSFRPSAGGGALHELEVYPFVSRCEGLEPGAYHYRAADHQLTRIQEMTPTVKTLLDVAGVTATLQGPPQVLFLVAARFQRVQMKYQSMAYAVILKNVGALYQTMYLVGTAMNLAPCALGGGHSDLFAESLGLNYYQETSVGEFILGTRGPLADEGYQR
ncbi:MAG: SagB family peptide dehydrogenase [Rubripirellula sp.]